MATATTHNPIADILKVPELKRRIAFTLAILAAYRVGAQIPVPGVNAGALFRFFAAQQNTLLGFLNIFSGGAMGRFAIFAMGVGPYINASIIMSLLQGAHVIPYLDRLAKEGEQGRKQMNQITRYLTLALAGLQSFGLTLTISRMTAGGNEPIVANASAGWIALTVLTLTAGSVFIMWLGEQITERGIGNGVSLIIFTGIVDRLPSAINGLFQQVSIAEVSLFKALLLIALVIVITGLCVWVETAQRKIPVQYAKRMVGRRMYSGTSTYLPLKVDQSGVIAVIFAVSLLAVPVTLATFMPHSAWAARIAKWERGNWVYELIYAALIIFFCYFYNSVQFNPSDLADNLRKSGGFVPGLRPGEATAKYIEGILARITLGGSLFVAAISVLPDYLREIMNAPFFFGGTALLIVVGVALDTIGQVQSHLIMRHYDGFFKGGGGGFKGRWFNVGS